jgi:hypothetical protein
LVPAAATTCVYREIGGYARAQVSYAERRSGGQRTPRIAEKIVGRGGDYVLAPKTNRSVLHIVHKDIDLSQPTL